MNINNREQLWESLRDPDFRRQLIDEHINVGIAFQIRSLRGRQNLTQAKLAVLVGVKQPLISEWENPNYGKYTLATLKELAKAFDVGLLVRFVPFSKLVDWTVDISNDVIAPPGFREEQYSQFSSPMIRATTLDDDSLFRNRETISTQTSGSFYATTAKVEEAALAHA